MRVSNAEIVTSYDSITGLASSRSHISSTCAARGVGVGRVDDEPDHLADVHLRDVGVPERRQRPLDGRARGVGDAGPVRHFDVRCERRHRVNRIQRIAQCRTLPCYSSGPYQSSRLDAGEQLVRLAVAARGSLSIDLGRHARRGRLVVPARCCP